MNTALTLVTAHMEDAGTLTTLQAVLLHLIFGMALKLFNDADSHEQ